MGGWGYLPPYPIHSFYLSNQDVYRLRKHCSSTSASSSIAVSQGLLTPHSLSMSASLPFDELSMETDIPSDNDNVLSAHLPHFILERKVFQKVSHLFQYNS